MTLSRGLFLSVLTMSVMLASCSYQLVKEDRASLPAGVQSVYVPLARNMTIEAVLEDVFTQELIKTLRSDGRIKLEDRNEADAELLCVIEDVDLDAISYTEEGRIASNRVTMTVHCRLLLKGSESVVWETGEISAGEDYPVGPDHIRNENQKALALREASKDIAESVRGLLIDSF